MNFEEEFDVNLREGFMVGFAHVVSWSISLAVIFSSPWQQHAMEQPLSKLIPPLLHSVSLSFACACFLLVPFSELLFAFPHVSLYLGIDGQRVLQNFARVSLFGAQTSYFLVNPFAFLFRETTGGGTSAVWTVLVELWLLLAMLLTAGLVCSATSLYDLFFSPRVVVGHLLSLCMYAPACLLFLFVAPRTLLDVCVLAWSRCFTTTTGVVVADENARDVQIMLAWEHGKRFQPLPSSSSLLFTSRRIGLGLRFIVFIVWTTSLLMAILFPNRFYIPGSLTFLLVVSAQEVYVGFVKGKRRSTPFTLSLLLMGSLSAPLLIHTLYNAIGVGVLRPVVTSSLSHPGFHAPTFRIMFATCFLIRLLHLLVQNDHIQRLVHFVRSTLIVPTRSG